METRDKSCSLGVNVILQTVTQCQEVASILPFPNGSPSAGLSHLQDHCSPKHASSPPVPLLRRALCHLPQPALLAMKSSTVPWSSLLVLTTWVLISRASLTPFHCPGHLPCSTWLLRSHPRSPGRLPHLLSFSGESSQGFLLQLWHAAQRSPETISMHLLKG